MASRPAIGTVRHHHRDRRPHGAGRRCRSCVLRGRSSVPSRPRKRSARTVHQGLRPNRHGAPLSVLGREPRGGELPRHSTGAHRRDRFRGGQDLLDEPRRRHRWDHPRRDLRRDRPQHGAGRRVDDHPTAREATDRRQRSLDQAEDSRGDPRGRGDEHLLQAADPRALLQPDLLRESGLRREGGGPDLLRKVGSLEAHTRGGRPACRSAAGAIGPRPDAGG